MYCPECKAEYREGIYECADCEVELVHQLPEPPPPVHDDLIPVFRTTNPILLPLVKSLLDSSEVAYVVQGEEALGLFPLGAFGTKVSRASLAAVLYVKKEDADDVERLLEEIEEGEASELLDGIDVDDADVDR